MSSDISLNVSGGGVDLEIENPFAVLFSESDELNSIERVLARYHKCEGAGSNAILQSTPAWGASFYNFDRSTAFQSLTPESQHAVLLECSKGQMEEAMMIEIAGMSFAAKMSLLSETLQQRELYSRFAADEASHYRMLRNLVGAPNTRLARQNVFLIFLSELIRDSNRVPLLSLIQVLLEGWGLSYYHHLASEATLTEVRGVLETIVADEAAHHGSGLILMKDAQPSQHDDEAAKTAITHLVSMLKAGPVAVFQSLARAVGPMSMGDVTTFLQETSFEIKLEADLSMVQRLLEKSGSAKLLRQLQDQNLFVAPSISQCSETLFKLQGAS